MTRLKIKEALFIKKEIERKDNDNHFPKVLCFFTTVNSDCLAVYFMNNSIAVGNSVATGCHSRFS